MQIDHHARTQLNACRHVDMHLHMRARIHICIHAHSHRHVRTQACTQPGAHNYILTLNSSTTLLEQWRRKYRKGAPSMSINHFYTRHMASKYTHVTRTFGGKSMLQKINPPTVFQILFPRILHCLHAIVIHRLCVSHCLEHRTLTYLLFALSCVT